MVIFSLCLGDFMAIFQHELINWGLYTIQEVKKENLHLIPE